LARGAIVITDRYVDSSLAYQAGGRDLDEHEIRRLSRWATRGLTPDLTLLLDVDPAIGLSRATGPGDRLEAEALAFHERVRAQFLDLARRGRNRHLVVDVSATDVASVHAVILQRVLDEIPDAAGLAEFSQPVRQP
jgi:dTMP kinase